MNDETRPVLVDSNVWLYMFLPGQAIQKAEVAIQLVKEYNSRIVVSTQVINETIRNIHRNRVMSEAQLRDLIDSFYADYSVVPMSQSIQRFASKLRESYSLSYWDSLLVSAGIETNAVILISEDMHNGLIIEEQLTIINPF